MHTIISLTFEWIYFDILSPSLPSHIYILELAKYEAFASSHWLTNADSLAVTLALSRRMFNVNIILHDKYPQFLECFWIRACMRDEHVCV